jgi:dihydroorotate dehydrogenase (fumarate)
MTHTELQEIAQSRASMVVTKSATPDHRIGNPEPRYIDLNLGSINSMGLPNQGLQYYLDFADSEPQKSIVSVAGLCMEDNLAMLKQIQNLKNPPIVELNLSCPNIPGKPQTGYDFERTKEVLTNVFSFYTNPLGVKLPPYFDMVHFEQMATILNGFPIQFVTCINSIGNALYINPKTEQVVIKPKDGFGGLGGAYIKPTALANVRQFYVLLRKDIAVIGCGGVENGIDVFEHILCGATAVQIGTQLMKEGVSVFKRLEEELKTIMTQKGYTMLSDFRGKLQSIQ